LPEKAKSKKSTEKGAAHMGPLLAQELLLARESFFDPDVIEQGESAGDRTSGAVSMYSELRKAATTIMERPLSEQKVASQTQQSGGQGKKPMVGDSINTAAFVAADRSKLASQQGGLPLGRVPQGSAMSNMDFLNSFRRPQGIPSQHFSMIGSVGSPGMQNAEVMGSPIGTGKLGNGPGVGMSGAGTQMNFGGMGAKVAGVKQALSDANATRHDDTNVPPIPEDRIQQPTSTQTGEESPNALVQAKSDVRFRKFEEQPKPTPASMAGGPNTARASGGNASYLYKGAKDLIPGGLADDKPNSDYPKKQVAMGKKVEMEHVNDKVRASEISKDHLEEIPDYYTRLDKMEREAEKQGCSELMGKGKKKKHSAKKLLKASGELTKASGYWSELAGQFNPLNIYGGSLAGGAAALATPTKTQGEIAEADTGGVGKVLANLLIPGVAPYRMMKRLGTSIRGPEIKEQRAKVKKRQATEDAAKKKEQAKAASLFKASSALMTKEALTPTQISLLSALAGGGLGAGAGALMAGKDKRMKGAIGGGLLGAGLGGAGGMLFGGKGGPEAPPAAPPAADTVAGLSEPPPPMGDLLRRTGGAMIEPYKKLLNSFKMPVRGEGWDPGTADWTPEELNAPM
jgi:hypothetical protein